MTTARRRDLLAAAPLALFGGHAFAANVPRPRLVTSGLARPESPKPMADGSVLVVEMGRGALSRVMPDGQIKLVAELGGSPNGCAIGPDGAVYVANNGGARLKRVGSPIIQKVDLRTGAFSTLYAATAEAPLASPNDLIFEPGGGFYFTDIPGPTGKNPGVVYWAKADGSLIRKVAEIPGANGIGLSPNHRHLYVAAKQRVLAFEIVGPGRLALAPSGVPQSQVFGSITVGRFDSMAVEAGGGVVVGTLVPGGLTVFAPDGGLRQSLPLPQENFVTSVGFGGPSLKTAFVTFTETGRLMAFDWPRPGLRLVNQ